MLDWRRLHIFDAVMTAGSLTSAAEQLGLSQPTVGRQIRALEAEVGGPLFVRTAQGLALTPIGAELRPVVEEMRRSALAASRLAGNSEYQGTVRIACGHWMARFLAANIPFLSDDISDIRIVIVNSYVFADIPRREADIAIRNRRPDRGRMATRRLPDFSYAVYARTDLVARLPAARTEARYTECPWAGFDAANDHLPTARWLAERRAGAPPRFRFSQSVNILDCVRSGAALGILPCFVGDSEPHLERLVPPFQPLPEGGWLVVNEDMRRSPHVRAVVERLVALFEARRSILDP